MSIYWSSCKLSTSFLFSNPVWGPQKWNMPLIPAIIENPQIAQHGQPRYQVPTLCFCSMPGGKSPFSLKPWSIFFCFFELYTCPWPSPRGQHCSLTVRKWCLHTEYSCYSRAHLSRKLLIRVYLEWMYDALFKTSLQFFTWWSLAGGHNLSKSWMVSCILINGKIMNP